MCGLPPHLPTLAVLALLTICRSEEIVGPILDRTIPTADIDRLHGDWITPDARQTLRIGSAAFPVFQYNSDVSLHPYLIGGAGAAIMGHISVWADTMQFLSDPPSPTFRRRYRVTNDSLVFYLKPGSVPFHRQVDTALPGWIGVAHPCRAC